MSVNRGEEARRQLLDAAEAAFAVKGFHGSRTRDITEGAGLSPAALYVYFPSKEDVLFEISRTSHEAVIEDMRSSLEGLTEPVDRLQAVLVAFVSHHGHHHTRARIANYELPALTPAHRAVIVSLRREIERIVRHIVEDGIARGAFRPRDSRMTTLSLLSLGIDVARWYRDDGAWAPEEVADHFRDFVMSGILLDRASGSIGGTGPE